MTRPDDPWTDAEREVLASLRTPYMIQELLDRTPYRTDERNYSPRRMMADGVAHCVDGALFAAAALRFMGMPPLIVDLTAVNDDEHLLAVFRRDGGWGAVAKSNTTGLRWREPVHRSVRELVMTYFDVYFNTSGERTLRGYSVPVDLRRFDHLCWMTCDEHLDGLIGHLTRARHYRLLTDAQVAALAPVDRRSYRAGFHDSNPAGLHAGDRLSL